MKVILLCAGYATRLYPLTKSQPKPLLPIAGRPIINLILDRLKDLDVDEAIVVTNHRFAGHFEKWAAKADYPWPIDVVDDLTTSNEDRLGAIGDLLYALKQKEIGSEDLMVIAGDNLFDFDLGEFVDFAETKRPHAVVAAYDIGDKQLAKQYGILRLGAQGKVAEFLEKPENPPSTLASCGVYWFPDKTRVLLDRYIREAHNADQPGHYIRWLSQNDQVYAVSLKGKWYDIGDLQSYEKADQWFRQAGQKIS